MSRTLKRKHEVREKSVVKKPKIQKSVHKGPIVRGDALKWKEAKLPDRLEDAEGFYGLEEIEDVEILKDEIGHVSFRPTKVEDVIVGDGEVAGEEWGGFGDDNDELTSQSRELTIKDSENLSHAISSKSRSSIDENSRNGKTTSKKETKSKKDLAKSTKLQSNQAAEIEDEIDFNALGELNDGPQVDVTAWKELDLSPNILSAISSMGFSDPTPIQRAAIPPIRVGKDVIGKAVTGSGKTLAFGIPIIERWLESRTTTPETSVPTAFILAPTRELAHQLSKHLLTLTKSLENRPRIATVTGGLALVKQQRQLEHADIIVGTPGRLWEVINDSYGFIDRLKLIQFLVIDEADRLLSEGHFKEVEEILDVLNRDVINETEEGDEVGDQPSPQKEHQRQTLVFSATFHKGLQQKLASKQKWRSNDSNLLSNSQSLEYLVRKLRFQRDVKPTFVDANPTSSMVDTLTESVVECGAMQKDLYLYSILLYDQHNHKKSIHTTASSSEIETANVARTLVFTNSISTVKRLVPFLTTLDIPNTTILPLHSSMPQKSRLRSLERFTKPPHSKTTSSILIATDVAARGLDIKGVHTVIHYHVPRAADTYIHRSGRTARASSSGRSILICSPDETATTTRLISKTHSSSSQSTPTIHPHNLPSTLPTQLSRRVSLAQKITTTTTSHTQTKSEDNWLRKAAEELGVEYDDEAFEEDSKRTRRGRGGERDRRKKESVDVVGSGKVEQWKMELKQELNDAGGRRRIDFGDTVGGAGVGGLGKRAQFVAGGHVDVEELLREREKEREREAERRDQSSR